MTLLPIHARQILESQYQISYFKHFTNGMYNIGTWGLKEKLDYMDKTICILASHHASRLSCDLWSHCRLPCDTSPAALLLARHWPHKHPVRMAWYAQTIRHWSSKVKSTKFQLFWLSINIIDIILNTERDILANMDNADHDTINWCQWNNNY